MGTVRFTAGRRTRHTTTRVRAAGRQTVVVLLALLVAALIGSRVQSERWAALIMLTAVGGLLVLGGAGVVLLLAALLRAYWTAGVALLLCLVQFWWLAGVRLHAGEQPAPAGGTTVRLLSSNLRMDNDRIGELVARLRNSDAHLLSIQEVTPEHLASLDSGGLLAAFPYRVADPLPGFHGSAIYSRWPLTDARAFDVGGFPMTTATVTVAGTLLRLVNVHVVAPLNGENANRWRRQLAELAAMPTGGAGATVLMGDFNATTDHRSFQALTEAGWRDAAREAGSGLGFTLPASGFPGVPLLRIDHAMVSEPLTVLSARTRENPGSDHRMLEVAISVPAVS